jgi:hypothetical protein
MSGRVGTLIWSMASLATAGCFLVGNYEVSELVESTPQTTDNEGETTAAVEPDVNPALVAPTEVDASISSEPPTGETTASTSGTVTAANSFESPTSTDEQASSSTAAETTSTAESTSTATSSSGESTALSDANDAGASSAPESTAPESTAPESTAPPTCPLNTEYSELYELCVFDCGTDGQRGPAGRCYWVGPDGDQMPWSVVPDTCTARGDGWNVLSVRSPEEHLFISGLLEADTWIGASDAATADRWRWLDDDTAFWQGQENGRAIDGAFEVWADNEPSAANDETCARYHGSGSTWTWSDNSCGPDVGSWGGGNGGNWGGAGEDEADVYLPACKGPAALEPD